jgi:hypothetical protein
MTLEYKDFNNEFFIVLCSDKKKYEDFFGPIGAKIHKDGFLISKEKRIQLDKIINLITIRENAKSRKEQTRYRREYSESETDEEESETDEEELSPEITKVNNTKYKKSDPKMYKKSFIGSRPVDFKKIVRRDEYSDDDNYSSSEYHSSSSDGFPSPSTPGRKYNNCELEIQKLYNVINEMKKRIKQLEK